MRNITHDLSDVFNGLEEGPEVSDCFARILNKHKELLVRKGVRAPEKTQEPVNIGVIRLTKVKK